MIAAAGVAHDLARDPQPAGRGKLGIAHARRVDIKRGGAVGQVRCQPGGADPWALCPVVICEFEHVFCGQCHGAVFVRPGDLFQHINAAFQ